MDSCAHISLPIIDDSPTALWFSAFLVASLLPNGFPRPFTYSLKPAGQAAGASAHFAYRWQVLVIASDSIWRDVKTWAILAVFCLFGILFVVLLLFFFNNNFISWKFRHLFGSELMLLENIFLKAPSLAAIVLWFVCFPLCYFHIYFYSLVILMNLDFSFFSVAQWIKLDSHPKSS